MKRVDKAPEFALQEGWNVSEYALNYDDFMMLFTLSKCKNAERAKRILSMSSPEVKRFVDNHKDDFEWYGGY